VIALLLLLAFLFLLMVGRGSMSEAERRAADAVLERGITDGLREEAEAEVTPRLAPARPKTGAPSPKDGR